MLPPVRENSIVVPLPALRRIFTMLVVLIVALVVVLVLRNQLFRVGLASLVSPSITEQLDKGSYQAVFLSGGQVFFGHLQQQSEDYFLLYDVFYLSVPDQAGQQGQLVKRRRELQGPREPMIIPTRNAAFLPKLREDVQSAYPSPQLRAGGSS